MAQESARRAGASADLECCEFVVRLVLFFPHSKWWQSQKSNWCFTVGGTCGRKGIEVFLTPRKRTKCRFNGHSIDAQKRGDQSLFQSFSSVAAGSMDIPLMLSGVLGPAGVLLPLRGSSSLSSFPAVPFAFLCYRSVSPAARSLFVLFFSFRRSPLFVLLFL
jgi:hypothetical protein